VIIEHKDCSSVTNRNDKFGFNCLHYTVSESCMSIELLINNYNHVRQAGSDVNEGKHKVHIKSDDVLAKKEGGMQDGL